MSDPEPDADLAPHSDRPDPNTPDGDLDALLTYLRDERGFDFTAYKRASLSRRIAKRMQTVGAANYQDYYSVLEANPGEFVELFNTILINVTAFQRDPDAWAFLASTVIEEIAESKGAIDPIRVWSAGCASGEEAYTLAVLFAEALGEDRFRKSVKIYATDADEDALVHARHARYPHERLTEAFGPERVQRFFEVQDSTGVFRQDLRHSLIFGRHDLIQDPPISRIDLLVCRNTLMYFTAEAQRRILGAFHFALASGGFLFLGKSEAFARRTDLFEAVDVRQHLFRKDGTSAVERPAYSPVVRARPDAPDVQRQYLEAAFEASPTAKIVVDRAGRLILANRNARNFFGIGISEIGRPVRDLEVSFRPVDLRTSIDAVLKDRRPVSISDVVWESPTAGTMHLEVQLVPLGDAPPAQAVMATFTEVGRYKLLQEELLRSQTELEAAYEELQSTVEELETTNEELQSTNEELETTNEELHSTNEELETMNEELQSTNEELETINAELRIRTSQLDDLNRFLQSILSGIRSGVVVLNPNLQVREWNRQAEDMWGLRADEVEGQHFLNLDIGLPVSELRPSIRDVLNGLQSEQVSVVAVNRRGRQIECAVSISPLVADNGVVGVILLMEAVIPEPAEVAD